MFVQYTLLPTLVVAIPFGAFISFCLWREFLSPTARARSRAYKLGYAAAAAATWHDSPFLSSSLTKYWRMGLEDARSDRSRREDLAKLKIDLASIPAGDRGNLRQ